DPGLDRAVDECFPDAAEDLEPGDREEERDEALPDPRGIGDPRAGDDRHAAAEGVGEHTRRDLPDEVRRLERGADEHQLEWIKVRDIDVVKEPRGVDERPREATPRSEEQVDRPRG